jgi:hypothetical protein
LAALLAKILLGLAVLKFARAKQPGPPGDIDVYRGDQWQETDSLSQSGKSIVTIGKSGDVALVGEGVPDVAARIFSLATPDGEVAMLEILDPEDPEKVVEVHELRHGDSHRIAGGYRLVYKQYQSEASFFTEEEYSV